MNLPFSARILPWKVVRRAMNLPFSALILPWKLAKRALIQIRQTVDNTTQLLEGHEILYERHANPIRSKAGTLRKKAVVLMLVQLGLALPLNEERNTLCWKNSEGFQGPWCG